jgi:hypothetical protein
MNVNLEILYEMNVNFERVIHFVHFGALVVGQLVQAADFQDQV